MMTMGSDPFWPAYLVNVNVLCVPAASISPQRFAEIFDILKSVKEIKTAELVHVVVSNGLHAYLTLGTNTDDA